MFYPNAGLLMWRIVLPHFFLTHGLDKWQRLFADEIDFGDPIGLGTSTFFISRCCGRSICSNFHNYGLQDSMGILISYCGNVCSRVCYSRRRSFSKNGKSPFIPLWLHTYLHDRSRALFFGLFDRSRTQIGVD